jgi:hypothetical protein
MGNVTRSNSLLDDIRFNPATGKAYLTDAGSPGLIVLDLESGMATRVLDDDPSTSATMPVSVRKTMSRRVTRNTCSARRVLYGPSKPFDSYRSLC